MWAPVPNTLAYGSWVWPQPLLPASQLQTILKTMLDANPLYASNSRGNIGPLFKLRIKIHSMGGARQGNGIALQQLVQKDKFSIVLEPKPTLRERGPYWHPSVSPGGSHLPWDLHHGPCFCLCLYPSLNQEHSLSSFLQLQVENGGAKIWTQYLLIKSSTLSIISELMGSSSLPHTDQPTLRKLQQKTTKCLGQFRWALESKT